MKKFLSIVLILTLIGVLTACSKKSSDVTSNTTTQVKNESSESASADTDKTTDTSNAEAKTVSIAVVTGSKPLSFVDDNGELSGYEAEVIKALDDLVPEYNFNVEAVEEEATQVGLDAGKYAFIGGGTYKTPEREEKYLLTDEISGVSLVYIYVREEDDSIKTMDDLVGKKVVPSSPNGGMYNLLTQYNTEHPDAQIKIETAEGVSLADRFKSIDSGEYDAAVLPNNLGFDEIKEQLGLKVKPVDTPVQVNPTYFLLGKDQTDLKEKMDAGLKTLRDNGTLSSLSKKWYGEDTIQYYTE